MNFVLTCLSSRTYHVNSMVILATRNMCGLHNLINKNLCVRLLDLNFMRIFQYLHISVLLCPSAIRESIKYKFCNTLSFFKKTNKTYHWSHSISGKHTIALVITRIIGRDLKEIESVGYLSIFAKKPVDKLLRKKSQKWILGFKIG